MRSNLREVKRTPPLRFTLQTWVWAVAVHVVIIAILQFSSNTARSMVSPHSTVEVVRVQAIDAEVLRRQRLEHQQAVREAELQKKREMEMLQKKKEAEARAAREREKAKQQKRAEEKRRALQKKRELEAKRKAEKAKQEAERRRKQEEQRKKAAELEKKVAAAREEAERRARELQEQVKLAEAAAETRRKERLRREQQEAARRARQINIWRMAIKNRIERFWLQPPTTSRSACEVVVEQNKKGEVLSAKVRNCSASQAWQESLREAVLKASPLPQAPRKDLFDRHLVVRFFPTAEN